MTFANFSVKQFLAEYWQRKPLLIKGALPGFADPLSPEELAGLACEPEVESRLVTTKGKHYQLQTSPFEESDFTSLPEQHWTLLVQAVDQFVPEVKALLESVAFIPSWRVDDVMISYATAGGGVGPHFDYYDVFLVQGMGKRIWKTGQLCSPGDEQITSSGLKLLAQFDTRAEYHLDPGDVLYVPPGVAHWGIAENDSLCYSLGFRAPSHSEMLLGFTDALADNLLPDQRFQDPQLRPDAIPGEITPAALHFVRQTIRKAMQNDALLARWFGTMQTEPRYPELLRPRPRATLKNASMLVPAPASRFAWTEQDNQLLLFVNGQCVTLPTQATLRRLLPLLCGHGVPFATNPFLRATSSRKLLEHLLKTGALLEVKPALRHIAPKGNQQEK